MHEDDYPVGAFDSCYETKKYKGECISAHYEYDICGYREVLEDNEWAFSKQFD